MGNPISFLVVSSFLLSVTRLVLFGHSAESPHYSVLHSESDYEIRLYKEISWISAFLQGNSFEKSTKDGFHRIYQYVHGANSNSSQLALTAPVLTSTRPLSNGSEYNVKLFLTSYYEAAVPPQPNPELNLQLDKWRAKCVAVRKFSGFAKDYIIGKEAEALVASLHKHLTGNTTVMEGKSYTIAQYNASTHLEGRLNEVWVDVNSAIVHAEGCPHP